MTRMTSFTKKTKVTIGVRPGSTPGSYHLVMETYPAMVGGVPKRIRENTGRQISTPKFESVPNSRRKKLKRDHNGVIICSNPVDQESCIFAENLRKKKQAEIDEFINMTDEQRELREQSLILEHDFIDYMNYYNSERHKNFSNSIIRNWIRTIYFLVTFNKGAPLPLKNITISLIEEFKQFLLTAPRGGNKKDPLAQNSAATYFAIFKAALRQCYRDGYLPVDFSTKVDGIPEEETQIEHLTREELQRLANTPCDDPILYRAALFSAFTGLRHSDIKKLTWGQIIFKDGNPHIDFRQQKTKGLNYHPITAQALELCGTRLADDKLVFDGLRPAAWINRPLKRWLTKAGITRRFTFHGFRHTCATLLITQGVSIYTVSKILGHRSVRTTERYAKVVDKVKQDAVKTIQLDLSFALDSNLLCTKNDSTN